MNKTEKFLIALLRVAMGGLFFYAGITKVLDSSWSAAGYISSAKNFLPFFQTLLEPSILPIVNILNSWGLTLLGISLILGLFVRLSSILGAILMLLYYFALPFPHPNAHALVIDEHIIYTLVLLFFATLPAGRFWGLDSRRARVTWLG